MSNISVLAAPMMDPGVGRIEMDMPTGMTVGEIVASALPGATGRDLSQTRVALISAAGSTIVDPAHWQRVRPRPGVRVVIRILPGKDALRSVLMIVVSIAAVALGQFYGPALAGAIGVSNATASGIIGLGVNVLGGLLINALIPPAKPKDTENNQSYQITGWKNRIDPNGVVPDVMGKIRYAPPFGATSWTEIVGDLQYVRAVFCAGYGPVGFSEFRLGDTSFSEYDEITLETREGLPSDAPLTLYTSQVNEENVGTELARPMPRDDKGEVDEDGVSIETPIVRTTGPDAASASIIIGYPAGLVKIDDKGKKKKVSVSIRVRQRLAGTVPWIDVLTLKVSANKTEAFFRQHTWSFAVRGRYEIELTRMTDDHTSTNIQSRTSWVALQTLRPEYPFAFGKPLALIAVRIKATYQLNGGLDNLNCMVAKRCLDWDAPTQTWIVRETSNPASLFRLALQGPANPRPVADSGVYLDQLQSWHEYCTLKGLKFDRVLEDDATLRDQLAGIARAGRATQRHDGVKWGVVVDRPQELVVDHINPRNSWQFSSTRTYFKPPHGFRVSFQDATNDYKPAERLVPWPGHVGDITLTEALELPGKTDPAEIWREARRRMYEALHRPDTYTVVQDGPARVATRGDLVVGSFDTLQRTQVAARVKSVTNNLIELDDIVTMNAAQTYAVRFRIFADENDTIGTSIVRNVVTRPGEQDVVVLSGDGHLPIVGDLLHFGEALTEGYPLIVTRVEAGDNFASVYKLIDASPIIDELTDAEVAPAWSGRVGDDIGGSSSAPPTPRFGSIRTGFTGTESANGLAIEVEPGSGPVITGSYRLQHRAVGASAWISVEFPVANGGTDLAGYAVGSVVQMQVAAISPTGVVGAYAAIVTVTIGEGNAPIPVALDGSLVTVGALLGGAVVMMSTGPDASTVQIQLYRSSGLVLDRDADAVGAPNPVLPSRSYTYPDGDMTRVNLLDDGSFEGSSVWTAGAGWTVGSGVAAHASGDASSIGQPVTVSAGKRYRVAFKLSGVIEGAMRPRLLGGSNVNGQTRGSNGSWSDVLTAVVGNNTVDFAATADFAGTLDDAVLFEETTTCLTAGTHYYWLEPQNADGMTGPVAGPFPVIIR